MKTTRRHDLQTNELSQQIEQVWNYAKENATILTVTIVGAAILITGASWYFTQQSSELQDGWARLAPPVGDESTASLVARYRNVAEENISPAITRAAWLGAGNAALGAMINPKKPDDLNAESTDTPDPQQLADTANRAFSRVRDIANDDLTAYARATWGLALIAEEQGEIDQATSLYKEIAADTRLSPTGLCAEAGFRLAHLSAWAEKVEFAPPSTLVLPEGEAGPPAPGSSSPVGSTTPIDLKTDPRLSARAPGTTDAQPPAATDATTPAPDTGADKTPQTDSAGPATDSTESESAPPAKTKNTPPPAAGAASETEQPGKSTAGSGNSG